MGYGLYYENMLSSVIYARDTYLSDQGVLMPSTALVYLEAMTATGAVDRVAWWGNVYGFDMTDMADLLSNEAQVQLLDQDDIISNRSLVHNLDIKLASDADLDFIAPFTMVSLWFYYSTSQDKFENLINLSISRI
jgi:protein arginine N-methyltransferase 3